MFKLVFVSMLFLSAAAYAQVKVEPTNQFVIEGNIDKALTVSVHTVDSFKAKSLGDVTTLNHLGEVKSLRKNVKGVLLKDIMSRVKIKVSKPNELFSHYFIFTGSDGYKVVLSYNEIFNQKNVYVVTESYGKTWQNIDDRVAVLVLTEPNKGHLVMKGLLKLTVEKLM
jgi:hypothetical protein